MAEIKIEKKRPIWPWIILILVILALLYFVFNSDEEDVETENTEDVSGLTTEENALHEYESDTTAWNTGTDNLEYGGIEGLVAYVGDTTRMGSDHEYTHNALIRLSKVVQKKANELNLDVQAEMQEVKANIQLIQQNSSSTDHANTIKQAGSKLTEITRKIQKKNYPNLGNEVDQMQTAVDNLNVSKPTLEQKAAIQKFFSEAVDVLEKMT